MVEREREKEEEVCTHCTRSMSNEINIFYVSVCKRTAQLLCSSRSVFYIIYVGPENEIKKV